MVDWGRLLSGCRGKNPAAFFRTQAASKARRSSLFFSIGIKVVNRYRVIDNKPQHSAALVDLGLSPGGVPVHMHRAAVKADLRIATGIVEPHQYAGSLWRRCTQTW